VRTAYLDPNDPTTVYLAQPATERIESTGYPTLFQRTSLAALMVGSVLM
jgi:hypothetical protein